ncbi:uncharacterized protein LOC123498493 [Portunus trituberculatus]|uniref:uncharacterized protein LOC123498493 n=1 Tax=Portunus trituberculatus TaxID=210409 RepID=UPI001E1CEAA2|nr:uncharacterized protein LOC123498493 [Portunus trituberculatus]
MEMPLVNGHWSAAGRGAAPAPPPPGQIASPKPDQGYLMSGLQTLMEQMSHLTQDVDGLKTQMQHHCNERALLTNHSTLEMTLPVQSAPAVPKKRLTVPPSRMAGLVVHVVAWYAAVINTFGKSVRLLVCAAPKGHTLRHYVTIHNVLSLLNLGHKTNMTCIASLTIS